MICQEYLGAHAAPDDDDGADAVLHASLPPPWGAARVRVTVARQDLDGWRVPTGVPGRHQVAFGGLCGGEPS